VDDNSPTDPDVMVGRDYERRILSGLVDSLTVGGGAVVVFGEPGMGKSSLLKFVAEYANGQDVSVRTLRGIESEAVLPFAAIADLLLPMLEHLTTLPAIQREAVEVCLALSARPPHRPLAACAGTLGVLAAAADQRPLLILIDDFQWLDFESAQMLQFAARRLAGARLGMVLVLRAEPGTAPPDTDLPMLSLAGLSMEDCARLASAMGVTLAPPALASLLESTGGNPLAVVERLRPSADAWPTDWWPSLQSRRLHRSLERSWGRLFDQLPDEARTALFLIAAGHDTGGHHTIVALKRLGLSLSSLDPAERLGVITCMTNGGIGLRHPLLRSLVLMRTPLADRVSGYRALADAAVGCSRSWYLAAAAMGPDEEAAAELVASAEEARQRNGLRASARTFRRAAELTADPKVRAQRLLHAAQDAHLAGDSSSAVAWCEQALRYRDDPSFVVDLQRIAGCALTSLGEPRRALELMTRAAERARSNDPTRAAEILAEAAAPAIMKGEMHLGRDLAEEVECIWGHSPDVAAVATSTALAMVARAFSISGEIARAGVYLRRAAELPPSSDTTAELNSAAFHAQSLGWAERYSEARFQLTALLHAARRLGSPSTLALALPISAEIGWWSGDWTTAYADATEALQWATENGQSGLLAHGLSMLARIEAARGNRELCRTRVDKAQHELEPRGISYAPIYGYSLGLAALGAGEPYDAGERLQQAWDLALGQGINNPNVIPIAGDLAEALARAGEFTRCARIVSWLDERAQATGLAYPRAAACRARGILAADSQEAGRLFAASLAALDEVSPVPFEQARTLLCSGEVMRRNRSPAAARLPLNQALQIFDGLDARPWAARTRAELAASGVKDRRRTKISAGATRLEELSSQELQVARIAARGQNNIEVAAALFVSRKTVEAHLTRIYRKLGIRSRTELARIILANGIAD
jgi:ATP/maltotriose-dependent transcriptional regulator MalT